MRQLNWHKNLLDGDWELFEEDGEHHTFAMRAYIRYYKDRVAIKLRTWNGKMSDPWTTMAELPPSTSADVTRSIAMNFCLFGFDTGT